MEMDTTDLIARARAGDLDHLPDHFADLLEQARAAVERDPRAVGLVINGSVAAGTADEYSDLDLLVLYSEATADLPMRAHELTVSLGGRLVGFTGEHVGEPSLVIALLDEPLRHVDVKCALVSKECRRVEDGVVVWERDSAVTRARAGTEAQWPDPDAQWIEDRVWVWIHYAAAKAGRGELLECLDALSLLRAAVLGPLISVERGARPSGVRRLERIAPDRLPQLHATLAAPNPTACLEALIAAADLYRDVRPLGVITRDRAEAAVRDYIARQRAILDGLG